MAELSFITTCMGRLAHLQQTLGRVAAQPRSSCVVVDYSCPERCGDWVEAHFPQVRVVRVTGQERFHPARARNLGAQVAASPWLCFVDADTLLAPHFAETLLPQLRPGTFYCPEWTDTGLYGTVLCARADFDRVRGYDEVIQGWGGEDLDLYHRLLALGLARVVFSGTLASSLAHTDEMRVRFYEHKDKQVSWSANDLYVQARQDLGKLLGRPLSPEECRQIYELAGQAVRGWHEAGRPGQVTATFLTRRSPADAPLRGSLTYVYGPEA